MLFLRGKAGKSILFLCLMLFSLSALAQTEITSLSQITDQGGNYKLVADINASGNTSIISFSGTLDGNFHTITGLSNAIFETVNNATVKNIILDNVNISSGTDVGAIANTASGNARIYNCGVFSTSGTSSISGTRYVGSIVGALANNARVLNCFSYANVGGGTRVAGIVGNNGGTAVNRSTILSGTGSMVFNSMFFGQITSGTNKYPIYGGTAINNVSNINTYNYFLYHNGITYADNNTGASGIVDESLLTRFDMYRGILNSHRDLCAMYIYNTQSPSSTQKQDIALWLYNPAQKETIPYLQLEPCIVGTRRTLDRPIPTTMEDYKGRKLRDVSCTFVINGRSYTATLPITDMDVDNWDYTWGKIVLPFANEFSGWSLPASGSNNYDNIITGWEITSITGGTAGSWDGSYDLCNPDCTAKDLYSNSNYVWAQGGNYVVPTDVTAITFTAHIARAVYLADSYVDIAYNNTYTTATNLGTQITGDTYNGKTVYHTLKDAYTQLQNKTNPADQAIVLVGNYHELQRLDESAFVDAYYYKLTNTNYTGKAATFMSIDADRNQVPDYNMPFYLSGNTKKPNNSGRTECPSIRFDFLCCPGVGISSYTRNGYLADVSIFHSKGWLEFTETCMIHTTEFEIRPQNFSNSSPVILNGGIHDKLLQGTTSDYAAGNNDKLTYIRLGGKAYVKAFWPGNKNNSDKTTISGKPINVSGGQIDQCYMTADADSKLISGNINFYCNGGYIKEYLGAYQQQVTGNVTTKIDHALIDAFYGGGSYDSQTAQIAGNIDNTINNSYVKFYCAGPKFGMMADGKTVTTHATGTTFGEYYGAGYGGTALTKVNKSSASPNYGTGDYNFAQPWTTYTDQRLKYDATYGTGVGYSFLFNMYAGGAHQGNATIYVDYARLSLASTRNVSSTLTNCRLEQNFYGGGCQGMVNGTITNILNNCTVVGSVFGGGYKASATPINVYPTTQPTYAVFKAAEGLFTEFGTTEPEVYSWVQSNTNGTVDQTAKTISTTVDMSQMGRVTGAITTTVSGGTVGENVFGGGNESPSNNNTTVLIKGNAQVALDAFGGGNIAPVDGNTSITLGQSGVVDNTQVARDIYGGGALANVGGNTEVNLLGGSVTDVYGGGLGNSTIAAIVNGNSTVTLNGSIITGRIFGCNNLNGTPKGHAKVHVIKTTQALASSEYHLAAVYGGGNQAAYRPESNDGFAEVLIEGCDNSIEYVYGGGNAASTPATTVTVQGGYMYYVFGGGNGAGQDNPGADVGYFDFTYDNAHSYGLGTTQVNVYGGVINTVFGGSNTKGNIRTKSTVKLDDKGNCDFQVDNVYGAGNEAYMDGTSSIEIGCVPYMDVIYGGSKNADVNGNVELSITSGKFGKVFGGNDMGGSIKGSITVNIEETGCYPVIIDTLYGCGNNAAYSVYGYNSDGTIKESGEQLYADPTVNIYSCTRIDQVYGGGLGTDALVAGNPTVNINMVKGIHAGTTSQYDGEEIPDQIGRIGTVFGGGNAARVSGDTYVNIGTLQQYSVLTGVEKGVQKSIEGINILGNVYGGGNKADVSGATHVTIGR